MDILIRYARKNFPAPLKIEVREVRGQVRKMGFVEGGVERVDGLNYKIVNRVVSQVPVTYHGDSTYDIVSTWAILSYKC